MYWVKRQQRVKSWFILSLIPVRIDCKFKNTSDTFCYIVDNIVFPYIQAKNTDFAKKAYCDLFGVKLGDQD